MLSPDNNVQLGEGKRIGMETSVGVPGPYQPVVERQLPKSQYPISPELRQIIDNLVLEREKGGNGGLISHE